MTRAALLAYIDNNVYPNANNEITALMVRDVLHRMVDFLGDAATYGVGDVALNNGGLVTGGAVQSAINTTLSSAIMFQGVTTTPLTDGSTNPNITIDGESYTAHRGDEVIYGGKEFLWTGTKWQQLGDEESWAAKTITISAGAGLTGGGNLTQNRTISLSQDSLDKLALAASAYQLPTGGIPKTDLASAVQNSLGKADTVAGYFSNDKLKLQNLPALYVARTQVSGTAANKTLYGVDGISAAAAADANDKSLIEWDDTNKAWHVHGGLYADGYLSGGGLSQSSTGGGGGGLDPALMGKYLTNDPTLPSNPYANTKIAEAHLPDLNPGTGISASYSGNLYLNLSLNYSAVAGQLGLSGMAYKPANQQTIIDALGYTPVNPSSLGSFAYKNALSVSDIPDLSGTYVVKGGLSVTDGTIATWGTLTAANGYSPGMHWESSDGGDATISYKGGQISMQVDGWFYQNEGRYRVADTSDLDNYLPLTGGTLQAASVNFFNLNATSGGNCWQYFIVNGTKKASVGYYNGLASVANEATYARIGVNDAGTPQYWSSTSSSDAYTLYHSGNSNKSDVAWACSWLSASEQITGSGIRTTQYYWMNDAGGTQRTLIERTGNTPIFGYGFSAAGYACYYSGYGIHLYAGGGYNTGHLDILPTGNVGFGMQSPEYRVDVNGVTRTGGHTIDNTPFLTSSIIYGKCNDESSGESFTESKPSWGITFQREWGSGRVTTMGGIYAVGSIGWRAGLAFRVKNNTDGYGSHDTTALWISPGGLVGVNNLSPAHALDVTGVIHASTGIWTDGYLSGGGLSQSSDQRLKRFIEDFSYTPGLLMALRPREWEWNEKTPMEGHAAGFVAQEVEGLLPYMVDDTREYLALYYDQFHALEVAALQDHERRIVELERAVKERDKKIEKLEKMLKLN